MSLRPSTLRHSSHHHVPIIRDTEYPSAITLNWPWQFAGARVHDVAISKVKPQSSVISQNAPNFSEHVNKTLNKCIGGFLKPNLGIHPVIP